MKVSMPEGSSHGWGIAGDNLRREIALLPPLPGVTLHCISSHGFEPCDPSRWDDINIGYCFFEHNILAYRGIFSSTWKWDTIVAGSSWCEHHLRIAGAENTTTILQGIDPALFHLQPHRSPDNRFIVFSGGKFEYRKGQDLVIAAMRTFMQRHPDVWLSCAWHNLWSSSIKSMEQSRLIKFRMHDLPCVELYREILRMNDIDLNRVIVHPKTSNSEMSPIYRFSDIGIFPNRCEGGNNMVMCEYMACGRPVIASPLTGHADVITTDNAFRLSAGSPETVRMGDAETGVWFSSSVEEIIDKLEYAYAHHKERIRVGTTAAHDMLKLDWKKAALQFHAIARDLATKKAPTGHHSYDTLMAKAERLFNSGDFEQAEQMYRSLLLQKPLDAELYNCLGTALDCQQRYNEAILCYSKALSLRPALKISRFNLSNSYKKSGNIDECIANLQVLLAEDPGFIDAWQNLGACMYEACRYEQAIECFERVVALAPERSGGYASLGETYHQAGTNLERGIECIDRAIEKQPGLAEIYNLKGLMHHELEQFDKALSSYQEGLRYEPNNTLIIGNIGNIYLALSMPSKAIMYFNLALEIEPESGSLRFNRGMARLLMGDYTRGWIDYEYRFNKQDPVKLPPLELPFWNGEELHGKTILVRSEQVYGDAIQFIRFLHVLRNYGGSITFECLDANLRPLFDSYDGFDHVVTRGEALPPADCQIALASLPHVFNTQPDSIPLREGYLRPDAAKTDRWTDVLSHLATGKKLKVGLVWGGRKTRGNANRSLTLSNLAPLFNVQEITWFSLQTGDDRYQVTETPFGLIDLSEEIKNFADTAAIIASLDLVISIDTAIAHLTGALGVPAWVMLKSSPDWRWGLEGTGSIWYSSARLFRQTSPGNWGSVTDSLLVSLNNLLTEKKNAKV